VAVWRGQGRSDGGIIALDAAHKADQFGNAAAGGVSQPDLDFLQCPCANNAAKIADEPLRGGDRRALLTERCAVGAFVGLEILDGAKEKPVRLAG
jgi:hypothetical protein